MEINIIYDDIHWLHRPIHGYHPENPDRLERAVNVLKRMGIWSNAEIHGITLYDESSISIVHSMSYIEWIRKESMKGFHYIDPDTYVTRDTYRVALGYSSMSRYAALNSSTEKPLWLILPRPPGHHAGFGGRAFNAISLGFCIFNHIAVIAKTLVEKYGRVLVIDFDVHHGNGTQEIFWENDRVIHIDIHEENIYPGTGDVDEHGHGRGAGSKINIPIPHYSGDKIYAWVLKKIIEPIYNVYGFRAVAVSAGFDAYIGEDISSLMVSDKTYTCYGYFLYKLLSSNDVETIIVVLEGGYRGGLLKGFSSFLKGLMGKAKCIEPSLKPPPHRIYMGLKKVLETYHGITI